MTDRPDRWWLPSEAGPTPAGPSHPDPSDAPVPAPADPDFPRTGWSATVMNSDGATWQAPGPSYEWAPPSFAAVASVQQPTAPATASPSPAVPGRANGSRLGVTAFGLVTAMSAACIYLAWCAGKCAGMAMVAFSTPVFDPMEIVRSAPSMSDHFSALCGLGFLASLVGIVGLGMAIAARVRRSAPSLSLTAVILGLCTPMLAFIALLAATEPFIHQMS